MSFRFDFKRAEELQLLLSRRIVERDCFNYPPKIICGVDVSYRKNVAVSAAVNLDFHSMGVLEEFTVTCSVNFPYIPGFFAFRELRPILLALKSLSLKPDVILVDGHGRAHPRRFGLASHLGLILDASTIGVAKRLLCGDIVLDKPWREDVFPILLNGEVVGVVIKRFGKSLFVSVGHRVCLDTAVDIVLHCIRSHIIPIPILLAHNLCKKRLTSLSV
ncbi:MAG TPA: endonuclease V [Candidatus Atribacteria bacterium]|nr:endonuclease V [Candidatus Atribacteria bacterium]